MSNINYGFSFQKMPYSEEHELEPNCFVEVQVDQDSDLDQMCRAFELFLKASGYELGNRTVAIKDKWPDDYTVSINKDTLQSTFDVKM
mgnify:CR=1 FL=1